MLEHKIKGKFFVSSPGSNKTCPGPIGAFPPFLLNPPPRRALEDCPGGLTCLSLRVSGFGRGFFFGTFYRARPPRVQLRLKMRIFFPTKFAKGREKKPVKNGGLPDEADDGSGFLLRRDLCANLNKFIFSQCGKPDNRINPIFFLPSLSFFFLARMSSQRECGRRRRRRRRRRRQGRPARIRLSLGETPIWRGGAAGLDFSSSSRVVLSKSGARLGPSLARRVKPDAFLFKI